MTKHSIKSLSIISIAIFLLFSCKRSNQIANKEIEVLPENIVEMRADQVELAKIETGLIESRSLSSSLKVNGIVAVAPQNFATICMPMGGFVRNTTLMPGNVVSKGQILAILENQDFVDIQQNYLQAKNKFEFAEAEYKRHSELYKNDVYSQQNLQQVTSDYKNLKAQVKALEQKLALIGINSIYLHEDDISSSVALMSPISGHVKTVNVNIGKYVAPADVLFEIVNSDKLILELTLFEKDAAKVSAGLNIRFFINNETEQHSAVIYQTGKSVNADKTIKIYANVKDNCKNILPGMYVNAVIEYSGNKVSSVPSDALVSFNDQDYIFIFERNKEEKGKQFTEYRMVEVHKGVSFEGYTEIILTPDFDLKTAKIVIKGAYNLLSAKKNAGEMSC
jgi:RND family efflux transporter MFP subunit